KVRSRLNGQILELMEADLLESLPRYCLPGPIAFLDHEKQENISPPGLGSPVSSSLDDAPLSVQSLGAAEGPLPPHQAGNTLHHFLITAPRKHKVPSTSRSPNSGGLTNGNSGWNSTFGVGVAGGAGPRGGGRMTPPISGGDSKRGKAVLPIAVDQQANLVLYGACFTQWLSSMSSLGSSEALSSGGGRVAGEEDVEVFLPKCVCVLSLDPLFDTLRAVALARAGFPEAGRAIPVLSPGGRGGGGGGGGRGRGRGDAGLGGGVQGGESLSEGKEWGLGDIATLRAPPPRTGVFLPSALRLLQVMGVPQGCEGGLGGWSFRSVDPLPLLDFSVEPLFQTLSSDNILMALSALMCERPVVVTCSVRSLLGIACEALRSLLHPLCWNHPYVPLLPATEVL
ncbi:unnamed protein product, partial [Choristocarpus tenellus]